MPLVVTVPVIVPDSVPLYVPVTEPFELILTWKFPFSLKPLEHVPDQFPLTDPWKGFGTDWVTVNVCRAMVMVPVRWLVPVLAATE